MFNPLKAKDAIQAALSENPKQLEEWNKQADTDVPGVRKAIIAVAEKHGVKLSENDLKTAFKMAKPLLGKLPADKRQIVEQLISKIV